MKVSKLFKAFPPFEDRPGPILLHTKEYLKSLQASNLDNDWAEGFKSKFMNAILKSRRV